MKNRLTITLAALQPRNPFATAARLRPSGMHRTSRHGLRQQARRALQRELAETLHPPHP